MSTDIPIFYINLDTRPDRRTFMEQQFTQLGLCAQRISAVSVDAVDADLLARYADPDKGHAQMPMQLCCSLGHMRAWRAFLDGPAQHALILEDDAVLSEQLPNFLREFPARNYDIVRIETALRGVDAAPWKLLTTEPEFVTRSGITLRRFRSTGWGSAAYIISRAGAEKLLDHPDFLKLPTDIALFCPLEKPGADLDVVQADPALAIQLVNLPARARDAATRSDNLHRPERPSLRRLWSIGKRQLRWGLIKGWDALTRPDLKRREIRFSGAQKSGR